MHRRIRKEANSLHLLIYEVEFDGDPQFPEGVYGFGIKGKKEELLKEISEKARKSLITRIMKRLYRQEARLV